MRDNNIYGYDIEADCKNHKFKRQGKYTVKIHTVFTLESANLELNADNDYTIKNTLSYIYSKTAGGAIFCNILNGHCTWTALYNKNYVNKLRISQAEINKYIKKKSLALGYNPKAELLDVSRWTNNGCLINMYNYNSIFNSYTYELIDMFETSITSPITTKFILWLKDFPIMTKKGNYLPIFSQSTCPNFYDICIPNNEEWAMIIRKWYPENCGFNDINKILDVAWTAKIEKGFFRGSGTGCIENNPRILVSYLSQKYPDILDAGIIKFTQRDRLENGRLMFMDPKKYNFKLLPRVSMYTWSRYKYIINIKGNGAAYRLPFLFYLGSAVLIVKSKFSLWFEKLLVNYHDYISIKEDLSDLVEIIEWCKLNDTKCKQIAKNGRLFADKWFNKECIQIYINELLLNNYIS